MNFPLRFSAEVFASGRLDRPTAEAERPCGCPRAPRRKPQENLGPKEMKSEKGWAAPALPHVPLHERSMCANPCPLPLIQGFFMSTGNLPMTLTETQPLLKSTEESLAHMAKPGAHSTPAPSHAAQGLPRQLRASKLCSTLPASSCCRVGVQGGKVGCPWNTDSSQSRAFCGGTVGRVGFLLPLSLVLP